MTTAYPGGIDTYTNPTSGNNLNDASVLHADQHANINDAVHAVEVELGINPHGSFATVKDRLDAVQNLHPRMPKVSSYMGPHGIINGAAGGSAFASGGVPFVEFLIRNPISIDQLGFRVSTLEAAMNAKVLLYSSDSDGYPVTLVKDSGAISCAATGDVLATFANVALAAGIYWATIRSNAGVAVRFLCGTQQPRSVIATGTTNIWNSVNYLQADPGTYASPNATLSTWSDNTTTGSTNVMPIIFMRRSV